MRYFKTYSRGTGFSMVEVLISTALLSLLFLGAVTLFVAAEEQAIKADATGSSATGAANAVAHITLDAREALWCALPDDANADFTPPTGTLATGFRASNGADTGVELAFPCTAAASVEASGPLGATVYDRLDPAPTGGMLWIYRADPGGTPDPQAGSCLWMQGQELGQAVSRSLQGSIAATPNAVVFQRPVDATSTPLPYQLQIKVVCASYSLINGLQSSEATDGTTVTLTVGKCVQLRDHEPGLDHEPLPTAGSGGGANAVLSN